MANQPVDSTRGERRLNYLADALDYESELTPAENRRRINALRAGQIYKGGTKAALPGHATNAGASQRMAREQREALKQGIGRRGR